MADKHDEQENGEPKIRIVDRRMLSEDERAGKGSVAAEDASTSESTSDERPKLEIIGGGTPKKEAAPAAQDEVPTDAQELDEADTLTEAEADQMRAQMENEQFEELEKQMGRPLTSQEKESVRAEMARQAEAVTRLEVQPLIMQLMAEMSARAAVHMGLMPNPYTRLVARNDAQARLAIDTFGALYEVLKTQLEPEMKREFERVLNDLRVNFVSITGTQLPPTGGAGGLGSFGGPRIIH